MRIIVDAMGGDNAPYCTVKGALDAIQAYGCEVLLVGQKTALTQTLAQLEVSQLPSGLQLCNANQVITMEDDPAAAFKEKKNASMTVGLGLLRDGRGDAFVSAGNTGALLMASTMIIRRIKGIRRAALATVVPEVNSVLIDCGATAEGKPEYLLQYAYMGSYYSNFILHRPNPTVGLLNIGTESKKGTSLQVDTYNLLKKAAEQGQLNFIGNIEPSEILNQRVDVIVADGFSGNIMLKTIEGTGRLVMAELKSAFSSNLKGKMGYLLVQNNLDNLKKSLNPNEVGGTPLLGLSCPVIKAHGSSNDYAIQNAIRQAAEFADSGFIEKTRENVSHMRTNLAKKTADRVLNKTPANLPKTPAPDQDQN